MSPNNAGAKRWLEFIKRDEWWQSQMPITTDALAGVLSMSGQNIQQSLGNIGTNNEFPVLSKIGKLIPDIESRKLAFPRLRAGRPKEGESSAPRFLWLEPEPKKISRLSAAWSLWAECQFCGNNKFLPIMMNDNPQVACYHCLPPSQYRAVGATPVKKSLVHEALKAHY